MLLVNPMTVKSTHPTTQKDFDNGDSVKVSVEEIKARIDAKNCSLAVQLIHALSNEDKKLVLDLLEEPLNVNEVDHRGVSALMVAAYSSIFLTVLPE